MPHSLTICVAVGFSFAGLVSTSGQSPSVADVSPITLSADGRFGVTVPESDMDDKGKDTNNAIVEVKTAHILGVIQGPVATQHMNNDGVAPTYWTPDDSALLWLVNAKWGVGTVILVNLNNGKIARQVDVLGLLQKEILNRTRAARPKDYAAVKLEGAGGGSWFKDGFAIDVVFDAEAGKLRFPVSAHVFLTSDVKGEGEDEIKLDSRMNAEVGRDGAIKATKFYLGQDPPDPGWLH
jgi:hypothetical protein